MNEVKWDGFVMNKDKLPHAGGVYGIFSGGECLYIGESKNMRRRFLSKDHINKLRGSNENLVIRFVFSPHHKLLEMAYIKALNPPMNYLSPFSRRLNGTASFRELGLRYAEFILAGQIEELHAYALAVARESPR